MADEDELDRAVDEIIAAHAATTAASTAAASTVAATAAAIIPAATTAAATTTAATTAISSAVASSTAASSTTTSIVAVESTGSTVAETFARPHVATASSDLCAVCRAKTSGGRVPKRKCTCTSGLTETRDTLADASKERTRRWDEFLKAGRALDKLQACAGSLWESFDDAFVGALTMAEQGDLAPLYTLFSSETYHSLRKNHPVLIDDRLQEEFGELCQRGEHCNSKNWSIPQAERAEVAGLYVAAGARITGLSTHYPRIMMNISRRTELRVTVEHVGLNHGAEFDDFPIAAPPLYRAAANGQLEMVQWLIANGADSDALASDGTSPLVVACNEGYVDVARVLLQHGADIERADQVGCSVLLYAVGSGHLGAVQLLASHGADLRKSGHVWWDYFTDLQRNVTPVSLARQEGYSDIADFLQSAIESIPMPPLPSLKSAGKRVESAALASGVMWKQPKLWK